MKKIKIIAGMGLLLLALVFAFTACSDEVATLAQPDDEGLVSLADHNPEAEGYEYYDGPVEMDSEDDDFWGFDDMPNFGFVTGTITDIQPTHDADMAITIEIGESSAVLLTNFNTFIMGEELEVGTVITGFFPNDSFMMAIYPPHYNVNVIVNNDDVQEEGLPFIFVDRFYELTEYQLQSADGELVINIDDQTDIILQSGEAFDGDIVGRVLVVKYAVATRSLPPQAIPIQIVVLYEMPVTGPELIDPIDGWEDAPMDWYCIVIDGEGLVGPLAIFNDPNMYHQTHVELRAVAEFLGSEVYWNADSSEVTMEGRIGAISFTVGSNEFTVDGQIVTLYHEAIDFYGTLYVPVLFFRDVFGMGAAYSFEGRVYINTEADDMQ